MIAAMVLIIDLWIDNQSGTTSLYHRLACHEVVQSPALIFLTCPAFQVPVAVFRLLWVEVAEGIYEPLIQKVAKRISFLGCETSILFFPLRPEYINLVMGNIKITTKYQRFLFLRFKISQVDLEITVPFIYSIPQTIQSLYSSVWYICGH